VAGEKVRLTEATVLLVGFAGDRAHSHETGGERFLTCSVATHRRAQGKEITDWHDCVIFPAALQDVARNIRRGHLVVVRGRLTYRHVTDVATGKGRKCASIVVDDLRSWPVLTANLKQAEGPDFAPDPEGG